MQQTLSPLCWPAQALTAWREVVTPDSTLPLHHCCTKGGKSVTYRIPLDRAQHSSTQAMSNTFQRQPKPSSQPMMRPVVPRQHHATPNWASTRNLDSALPASYCQPHAPPTAARLQHHGQVMKPAAASSLRSTPPQPPAAATSWSSSCSASFSAAGAMGTYSTSPPSDEVRWRSSWWSRNSARWWRRAASEDTRKRSRHILRRVGRCAAGCGTRGRRQGRVSHVL